MKQSVQFVLLSLVLSISAGAIGHAGEFKLIVDEEGTRNSHLTADIIGDTLIVGAHEGFGFAKIYVGSGKKWEEQAKLVSNDRAKDIGSSIPALGWSVSLTAPHALASADYALVGAARSRHAGNLSGAAYVFTRDGTKWIEQAKLIAADAAQGDEFGHAVSIDRNIAVIGAPGDDNAGSNSGSAYIFVRTENSWQQQAKLVPGDLARSDSFGHAVLVNGDIAVVGAPKHTHSGVKFTGIVYIFERQGETWVEQSALTANDAAPSDDFGHSLAMSGQTIIIGSPLNDTERGKDTGAVYVFARDGNGWKQEAKLVANDAERADQFGHSVATTGSIAMVGVPLDDEGGDGSGAAYSFASFARVDGTWEQKAKVTPEDAGQNLNYGSWVAMSLNTVVVSAHNGPNDGPESGDGAVVHIYSSVNDFDTPPFPWSHSD